MTETTQSNGLARDVIWKGTKVLVTGAGGFIGSHLTERLVRDGARVRAMVRYTSTNSWGWLDSSDVASDLEVVPRDICDPDGVREAMRGVEVVFHLAALIGIPYSYVAPTAYARTNVDGTLNVLEAAREFRVARVVHTSTSEVYGTARYTPIDEAHALQAQSPYSATKIAADKLAEAYFLSFNLPVVTVRPFNTFGPRQSARAVIPAIITQYLRGGPVHLGSLSPTRDVNYVQNTVDGFVRAASTARAIGATINLGTGRELSVGEIAHIIGQIIGSSAPIEQDDQRMRPQGSEVERLVADCGLARELLGWEPTVSVEDGLRHTISWFQDHLERYRPGVYAV